MGSIVSNNTYIPVIRERVMDADEPRCFAELFECHIITVSELDVNDIVWMDEPDGDDRPQFAQIGALIKHERGVEFINFSGLDIDENEEQELIGMIIEAFQETQVPSKSDVSSGNVVERKYIGMPEKVKEEFE